MNELAGPYGGRFAPINGKEDAERLNVHNGLLLSAWDAEFDRGLVTTTDALSSRPLKGLKQEGFKAVSGEGAAVGLYVQISHKQQGDERSAKHGVTNGCMLL